VSPSENDGESRPTSASTVAQLQTWLTAHDVDYKTQGLTLKADLLAAAQQKWDELNGETTDEA